MIFFNDALNIIGDFWHFLAPFTSTAKNATVNSLTFNNTGIFFIKIIKL